MGLIDNYSGNSGWYLLPLEKGQTPKECIKGDLLDKDAWFDISDLYVALPAGFESSFNQISDSSATDISLSDLSNIMAKGATRYHENDPRREGQEEFQMNNWGRISKYDISNTECPVNIGGWFYLDISGENAENRSKAGFVEAEDIHIVDMKDDRGFIKFDVSGITIDSSHNQIFSIDRCEKQRGNIYIRLRFHKDPSFQHFLNDISNIIPEGNGNPHFYGNIDNAVSFEVSNNDPTDFSLNQSTHLQIQRNNMELRLEFQHNNSNDIIYKFVENFFDRNTDARFGASDPTNDPSNILIFTNSIPNANAVITVQFL